MTKQIHWRRLVLLAIVAALGLSLSIERDGIGTAASAAEGCPPPSVPPSPTAPPADSSPSGQISAPSEERLACVGAMSITGAAFDHWATVARKISEPAPRSRSHRSGHAPTKKRSPSAHEVINEVMGFLISSDWVIGEAEDRSIDVSERVVRRTFDRIRHEQFPKRGEFQAFLRSSGQTRADLLFRVRLNLLSEKLDKQIVSGRHGASAQQQALTKFARAFRVKWKAQTYCVQTFAVADCGHVLASV